MKPISIISNTVALTALALAGVLAGAGFKDAAPQYTEPEISLPQAPAPPTPGECAWGGPLTCFGGPGGAPIPPPAPPYIGMPSAPTSYELTPGEGWVNPDGGN